MTGFLKIRAHIARRAAGPSFWPTTFWPGRKIILATPHEVHVYWSQLPCMVSGYDWKGSVMAVRKIGQRWYYDFRVRRSRYRGVIPEARTKAQAETAEVRIRNQVFDRKYNTQADTLTLAEFIDAVYLPYARLNKRHPILDELHCKTILAFFGKRTFSQITPFLIEKFKKERSETMTRRKKQRSPASVNRELEV